MRTIGLDVHKHFAEVAILNEGDRTVHRGDRVDATPAALRAFAATLGPNHQVVLEATIIHSDNPRCSLRRPFCWAGPLP